MQKTYRSYIMIVVVFTIVNMFSCSSAQIFQLAGLSDQDMEYCESSTICGTAPKEVSLLLAFVREMAMSIQTLGTEGSYLGEYVNPNRFIGNVFSPPQETPLDRVSRNVAQKTKFSMITASIFSDPTNIVGLKDMVGGVVLLSKNKVFVRDAKLIQNMESLVNDKKYELGVGGGAYTVIRQENIAIMQDIFETYKQKGLLSSQSSINYGVTYSNVTSLLTQLLSSMKTFLYLDIINQLKETSRGGGKVYVVLDVDVLENIKRSYNCARGIVDICNTPLRTFSNSMISVGTNIKQAFSGTGGGFVQVFTDANRKLVGIFAKKDTASGKAYKDRSDDLLSSFYGTTSVGLLGPLKSTWENIKKSGSEIGDQFSDFASDIVDFWTPEKDLQKRNNDIKNFRKIAGELPSQQAISVYNLQETAIDNRFRAYLEDVFINRASDITLASVSEIKNITPAFAFIGSQITFIRNDIIGTKDKDNSLIKSLGEACEAQCGGLLGRCRK